MRIKSNENSGFNMGYGVDEDKSQPQMIQRADQRFSSSLIGNQVISGLPIIQLQIEKQATQGLKPSQSAVSLPSIHKRMQII